MPRTTPSQLSPTPGTVTQMPTAYAQPPGTEVTPLEGMQQMGLAPDSVQTATPEGSEMIARRSSRNARWPDGGA